MFKTLQTLPNWQDITKKLSDIALKKLPESKIVEELSLFHYFSETAVHKKSQQYQPIKYQALLSLYAKELPQIYSKVAKFVLERPKLQIPLVKSGVNKEYILTKQHILYLYSSMMLLLIAPQQFDSSVQMRARYNFLMNFSYIFMQEPYKVATVIQYIKKEIDNVKSYGQKFIIRRNVETRSIQELIQQNKNERMAEVIIESDTKSIEDYYGCIKADFANKFLGGGALLQGCVQQQIMFANHPELFTAQCLCQVMQPNEAIHLIGYKKYSKNKGYGYSAQYDGPETHEYQYDKNGIAQQFISAIDAKHYYYGPSTWQQFSKKHVDRQLVKAFAGFNFNGTKTNTVATGNWGCGAFNGDLRLKFITQWIACSLAKKKMIYCPFGHRETLFNKALIDQLSKLTIGQNYDLLCKAGERVFEQKKQNIYSILETLI